MVSSWRFLDGPGWKSWLCPPLPFPLIYCPGSHLTSLYVLPIFLWDFYQTRPLFPSDAAVPDHFHASPGLQAHSHLINTYEAGDKQTQPQQNLLPGARCYTSRLHPPPPPLSPVCAPSSVSCKRAVFFGFAEVIWPPLTSLPVPSPSSPLTPRSGPCSSPGRHHFLSLSLITYQQTSALSLEPSSSCHLFQEVFFCPPRVCEGH